MIRSKGAVAAGHETTANAAMEILKAGGNAFDAALAALFASCVAEPVLASLGGGGFLLAHAIDNKPQLYDFFAHTPKQRPATDQIDLYPIVADFGAAQQEFHIGMGSIAIPGVVSGIFALHRDHGRMPMRSIIEPASEAARNGVAVNSFQGYISEIVSPIIKSSPGALQLHASPDNPKLIAHAGELLFQRDMADTFDALAHEGAELFYRGEMGQMLLKDSRSQGGCLSHEDLKGYQTIIRRPLELNYHSATIFTNPAPSLGGTLIAFALSLLQQERLASWSANGTDHLLRVARAQQLVQHLRKERKIDLALDEATAKHILGETYLQSYRESMQQHHVCTRGTTQISVADAEGNFASMTLSNGEGSGYVIPGTGIMMNNMLGEEDINPHGFNNWPCDRRIASMMSPTLVYTPKGASIVTGSGGSNRIRSAILQVLINLIDYNMPVEQAVEQPRLHLEGNLLNIEVGVEHSTIEQLQTTFPNIRTWSEKNLFFGGAHTVLLSPDKVLSGQGDSRRGGVYCKA